MHSNEATSRPSQYPTVVPAAEPSLEQLLADSIAIQRLGAIDRIASEYTSTLEQPASPLLPLMREVAKPARELVAIGALVFHAGPCCSECDGSGLIDTGHNHHGRHVHETCGKCGVESYGEVSSRGQRCGGIGDGDACAAGIYPERLSDGAFELPSGRLCCRSCAAIAVGYRGLDDLIDLGILNALEMQERA